MSYEVVFEIFNECSANVMRDVFFDEIEVESEEELESYIKKRHSEKDLKIKKEVINPKNIVFNITLSDTKARYTFSQID
ncbi:hypothetical protein SAMN05216249_12229 [Acetitomaculum ruminis DSM 5522]|uniref:Uncharacterized protein n=1 Tax=Acetitomaculum ruminis DSM 5522 TaxID=1120918 RepID=A0A1I1A7S8_9FIRM|nr:hypothetical protein [Acetitomaculum ruminis]SFB34011.1 hypothetical protein SAMN05216249_12229 [Acetitomaculum ruminis DSM 5522]